MLILDASVAISAVMEDATSPAAQDILLRVAQKGAVVPNLWHLEFGQTLLAAERRKKIDSDQRNEVCELFLTLPITVDADTSSKALSTTMSLAVAHQLTLYHATYLELSIRRSLPLATFDTALRRAGAAAKVPLV